MEALLIIVLLLFAGIIAAIAQCVLQLLCVFCWI